MRTVLQCLTHSHMVPHWEQFGFQVLTQRRLNTLTVPTEPLLRLEIHCEIAIVNVLYYFFDLITIHFIFI